MLLSEFKDTTLKELENKVNGNVDPQFVLILKDGIISRHSSAGKCLEICFYKNNFFTLENGWNFHHDIAAKNYLFIGRRSIVFSYAKNRLVKIAKSKGYNGPFAFDLVKQSLYLYSSKKLLISYGEWCEVFDEVKTKVSKKLRASDFNLPIKNESSILNIEDFIKIDLPCY